MLTTIIAQLGSGEINEALIDSRERERERERERMNHSSYLLLLLSGFLQLLCTTVQARGVLDAHDLAVGDWDVKVRCGADFYSTLLFPSSSSIIKQSQSPPAGKGSTEYDRTKKMLAKRIVQLPPLPFQTKAYSCQLSLFPNGTFTLRPSERDHNHVPSSSSTVTDGRLLLRGRWKVEANPYCITDRFYDELHLESYPRKLVQQHNKRQPRRSVGTSTVPTGVPNNGRVSPDSFFKRIVTRGPRDNDEGEEIRRLSLQLHCRLCGRYASAGPWRTIRGQKERNARLARGMLVWKSNHRQRKPSSTTETRKPRISPIGASFRGKRIVPRYVSSQYEEQEELKTFGY